MMPSQLRASLWVGTVCALVTAHSLAADKGIAATGSSGGLVIPSAGVLGVGDMAASFNNFQEPKLGLNSLRRNFSLGFGLMPGVELFGRYAEYQEPLPGSTFINGGPRDISANVKVQLPAFWKGQPQAALGLNDVSGGANFFKSKYAVLSDDYGLLSWTVGYALGNPKKSSPLHGLFGGVQLQVGQTGASVLLEHDGQHRHVGLRYASPEIGSLGGARLLATLQRSVGARDAMGRNVDSTSAGLSVVLPLGQTEARRTTFQPEVMLPPVDARSTEGMQATALDRQEALVNALVKAGFERVRVGMLGNQHMLIEYENHRYGQSEADALGIALGLAAEFAPSGVRRVSAVTLKAGLRVYESAVDVAIFRSYLRDGDAALARNSLTVDRAPSYDAAEVHWAATQPRDHSLLRVELAPDFAYHMGNEIASFDYSLALALKASIPLWRGGEVQATYVKHGANSANFEPGFAWQAERQRTGLKALSLQQSIWLGPYLYASVGAGKYDYTNAGVQAESSVFVPGGDDVIRLRGAVYQKPPSSTNPRRVQLAASYRWVPMNSLWVEAGVQQFGDGGRGPSLVVTRWFGDVGVHLHYHRSGQRQVAGLDISLPLTPRQGMAPGTLQVTGTPYFRKGIRTRIFNSVNDVQFDGARDMQLAYNAEAQVLNSGRFSQRYFVSQLPRMREAFFLYARDLLPK